MEHHLQCRFSVLRNVLCPMTVFCGVLCLTSSSALWPFPPRTLPYGLLCLIGPIPRVLFYRAAILCGWSWAAAGDDDGSYQPGLPSYQAVTSTRLPVTEAGNRCRRCLRTADSTGFGNK